MRTIWTAVIVTLAGAGAALADSAESLPAPRSAQPGTTPAPVSARPISTVPGPSPVGQGCACVPQDSRGKWHHLWQFLTYCPKPRGVNCYNCCEPLFPRNYEWFRPCIEGSGPSGCACCAAGKHVTGARSGVGLGLGFGGGWFCRSCSGPRVLSN
jgi:hypothetical protein